MSTAMLALFATKPYNPTDKDMRSHVTNTCSQGDDTSPPSVWMLDELNGLSDLERSNIINAIGHIVGEVFEALSTEATVFQPLPNAFEMYVLTTIHIPIPPRLNGMLGFFLTQIRIRFPH
uniref:Uncharacterized protein n=1 Tax=Compsopogon caeruleus TaxID=31354 RepID=A0A7S1TGS3_9RHOD|mmetsp:Transcript_6868/g.14125  ORF Transcript_6868/g.14125 Transcript_6868/m.14125 type:complete len:120 (+) Transcript_6868:599-958(+)